MLVCPFARRLSPLSQGWPHPAQDPVLDHVVMEKRGRGMKQRHTDNDICDQSVPCIDAVHEFVAAEFRKVPKVEQRKTMRKHIGDAQPDHDQQQQQLEQPVRSDRGQVEDAAVKRRQSTAERGAPKHPQSWFETSGTSRADPIFRISASDSGLSMKIMSAPAWCSAHFVQGRCPGAQGRGLKTTLTPLQRGPSLNIELIPKDQGLGCPRQLVTRTTRPRPTRQGSKTSLVGQKERVVPLRCQPDWICDTYR